MKMNELNESALAKVLRHIVDLDDLEKTLRKSKTLDKDTEKEINRKRKELMMKKAKLGETATGMGAASIAAVSGNVGPTISRNMYNTDGTMKNGLDNDNLLGGKKKSKKRKKA